MQCISIIAGLFSLVLVSSAAFAGDVKIPKAAQGVWAEGGKCGGSTVTITANTLQYKGAKPDAVYFAPKESLREFCHNWTFDKIHGTSLDMNFSAAHSLLLSTFA